MEKIAFTDLPEDVQEALELAALSGKPPETMITVFRDVSSRFPGFVPARMNLAGSLLAEGELTDARSTYEAVLVDFPEEPGAVAGLATVCIAEGKHAEALELADKAIASEYLWGPVLEARAKALEALGRTQDASEAYLVAYRSEPHGWSALEAYCRLNDRPYRNPMEDIEPELSDDQLGNLFAFIDETAHEEDDDGNVPGCDHTLRLTTRWAESNGIDVIDLYQFVNAHGGFCDCEVCFNVQPAMEECSEAKKPWWRRMFSRG